MKDDLWCAYSFDGSKLLDYGPRSSVSAPIALSSTWRGALNLALDWFKERKLPVHSPEESERNALFQGVYRDFQETPELDQLEVEAAANPDASSEWWGAWNSRWLAEYQRSQNERRIQAAPSRFFDPSQMRVGDSLCGSDFVPHPVHVYFVAMKLEELVERKEGTS